MSHNQPVQAEAISAPPGGAGQARRAWLLTEWMAGVFALLVGVGMLLGYVNARTDDPLKSPRLADLKENLRLNPADEQLKQNIRLLDLALRQHYFRHLWRMNSGVWMLLGAAALFGIAGARVAHYQKQPPLPRPNPEAGIEAVRAAARARWSVAACGATVGAGLFVASLALKTVLPDRSRWTNRQGRGAPRRCRPAMRRHSMNSNGTGPGSAALRAEGFHPLPMPR